MGMNDAFKRKYGTSGGALNRAIRSIRNATGIPPFSQVSIVFSETLRKAANCRFVNKIGSSGIISFFGCCISLSRPLSIGRS